ncbi:MAG TPA: hypothetical protein VKD89_08890 [Candidatus Udaeobacter sp.]|nr:hypothetical protein [Candidatus Udaeobacter sp.]
MPCHSVGCGMPGRMRSGTQSTTQGSTADHTTLFIRVYDAVGNVIEAP